MSRWNTAVTLLVASLATTQVHVNDAFVLPSMSGRWKISASALGVKNYMDSLSNPQPEQQPESQKPQSSYAAAASTGDDTAVYERYSYNSTISIVAGETETNDITATTEQQEKEVDVEVDIVANSFPDSPAEAGLHEFAQDSVSSFFVEPDVAASTAMDSSTTTGSGSSPDEAASWEHPVALVFEEENTEVEHIEPELTVPTVTNVEVASQPAAVAFTEQQLTIKTTEELEEVTTAPVTEQQLNIETTEEEVTTVAVETTTETIELPSIELSTTDATSSIIEEEKVDEQILVPVQDEAAELEAQVLTTQPELTVETIEEVTEEAEEAIKLEIAEEEEKVVAVEEDIELVNEDEQEEPVILLEEKEEEVLTTPDVVESSTINDDDMKDTEIEAQKSDDESVSLALENVSTNSLGDQTSRVYIKHRESLSASTARNQKRVSRSEFERKKAAEKIFAIKERMEAQIKDVGKELDDKLGEMQEKFSAEAAQIEKLLQYQVAYEANRKENINGLIITIKSAIETKRSDIEAEDKITAEMIDVRSKLKKGNISTQLDDLIEQKHKVAELEREQLDDLGETLTLVQDILDRTVKRETQIQSVLDNIRPLDLTSPNGVNYDFADLIALESMWKEAAVELGSDGENLADLKLKFDEVLLTKIEITGGDVPDSLQVVTKRVEAKKVAVQRADQKVKQEREMADIIKAQVKAKQAYKSSLSKAPTLTSITKEEDQKDEFELIGLAVKSLSSAAIDSAKAGIFGIRAIADTVRDDDIAQKLKKQDAESVQALGEIAKKMKQNKSAEQASTALKDTGSDLSNALKAIGALTKKNLDKMKEERK